MMKICPNCHAQLDDDSMFCAACGSRVEPEASEPRPEPERWEPNPGYAYPPAAPSAPNYDHTAEYDPADIAENKLYAMLVYLASFLGIIVALLAAKESPFASFHIRQAVKLNIAMALAAIATALLSWTLIVPIAGLIFMCVIEVVQIICFFNAANGKAVEAPVVRSISFLN